MKKQEEKTVQVMVRLEEKTLKFLKDYSIRKSQDLNDYYTHQDLIRQLINDFVEKEK